MESLKMAAEKAEREVTMEKLPRYGMVNYRNRKRL